VWKVLAWVLVAAAVVVPAPASAQGTSSAGQRIGVVDMTQVAQAYRRYQEAAKILEARRTAHQEEVNRHEEEVVSLIEDLDRIRATAAPEEIQRRRRGIEDKDRDLADFVERTNRKLRDDLLALQIRTREEVESVVGEVAQAAGATVVLERNFALYAAPDLDLTQRVSDRLNERYRPLPPDQAIPPLPRNMAEEAAAEGGGEAPGGAAAWPAPRREGFRSRILPPAR